MLSWQRRGSTLKNVIPRFLLMMSGATVLTTSNFCFCRRCTSNSAAASTCTNLWMTNKCGTINNNNNNSAPSSWRRWISAAARSSATMLLMAGGNSPGMITMAEAKHPIFNNFFQRSKASSSSSSDKKKKKGDEPCPYYGCQLLPLDILTAQQKLQQGKPSTDDEKVIEEYNNMETQLKTLQYLRSSLEAEQNKGKENQSAPSPTPEEVDDMMHSVRTMYKNDTTMNTKNGTQMATMTMIGYKGGSINQQINQDRSFAMGPYNIQDYQPPQNQQSSSGTDTDSQFNILLGVFDGHAKRGEIVSEYVVKTLPKMLSMKLGKALKDYDSNQDYKQSITPAQQENDIVNITKQILIDTFIQLDREAPAEISGGCTASVVFKFGSKIFIANAGDSVSFVGVYNPSKGNPNPVNVIYTTREDKPHLPDERERVEKMGGMVYVPPRGTSRVVYIDPMTQSRSGLAMSRSIGDWDFGKLGVIPDPIVDVLDIQQIIKAQKAINTNNIQEGEEESQINCFIFDEHGMIRLADEYINDMNNTNTPHCQNKYERFKDEDSGDNNDDIHIFAVSATDGMMDYSSVDGMATLIAHSLYHDGNVDGSQQQEEASKKETTTEEKKKQPMHLLTVCEILIASAANGWYQGKMGRYRDDIAISVSHLHSATSTSTSSKKDIETETDSTTTTTTTIGSESTTTAPTKPKKKVGVSAGDEL